MGVGGCGFAHLSFSILKTVVNICVFASFLEGFEGYFYMVHHILVDPSVQRQSVFGFPHSENRVWRDGHVYHSILLSLIRGLILALNAGISMLLSETYV